MMTAVETYSPRLTGGSRSATGDGISALRRDLVRMMFLSRAMMDDAMLALRTGDAALARRVVASDSEVDELDRRVEQQAIGLVAARQVTTPDLRFVGDVFKVSTDMERVADHAVNIARIVLRQAGYPVPTSVPLEIERMGVLASEMIGGTAEAFANDDAVGAETVIERDDEMDVLYREAQTELRHRMLEDPAQGVPSSQLLFVAHYLERVGDHCANASERLVGARC